MKFSGTVEVPLGDRSYSIHIGQSLLSTIQDHIPMDLSDKTIFILTDENVFMPHAQIVQSALAKTAKRIEMLALMPGEQTKSYDSLKRVLDWMLEKRVDRHSLLIAVGGGVIGDLGGFAASIVMRGIPFVQVPTTLLSMVDSSVGGKTGINTDQGKNLVGSFYQPISVVIDIETLKTLSNRELAAGYAEVVKYGLIDNPDFFEWLENNGKNVLSLEPDAVMHAIKVSCHSKATIVSRDEKESGDRALLNLGHTFGHALEALAGYDGTLIHGEAVSIGMVLAFQLSHRMGLCSESDVERVKTHLVHSGLPVSIQMQTRSEIILDVMTRDKKAKSGKISFILTKGIGKSFISNQVDMNDVKAVVEESMH